MQTYTHTLDNGFKIIFIQRTGTKICKLGLLVDAGSQYDDADVFPTGTSHFVEHMVFNGTEKYKTRIELLEIITNDGGLRGAETSYFSQYHYVSTLGQFVEYAFDYMSQTLLYPKFTLESLDKERKIIISEFQKNESDPDRKFYFHGVNACVFKNTALQNYPLGNAIGIESITLDNIQQFHKQYFNPRRMTVFAIGDFDEQFMFNLTQKYFSGETKTQIQTEVATVGIDTNTLENKTLIYHGIKNAKIAYVQFVECKTVEQYYMLMFLSRILSFGTDARLFIELREKRNLVYQISPNNVYTPSGFFV